MTLVIESKSAAAATTVNSFACGVFSTALSAGESIYVTALCDISVVVTSVTDNSSANGGAGNTYTQVFTYVDSDANNVYLFKSENVPASASPVNVNIALSGSSAFMMVSATRTAVGSTIDGTNYTHGVSTVAGTGPNNATVGPLTPSTNGSEIIVWAVNASTLTNVTVGTSPNLFVSRSSTPTTGASSPTLLESFAQTTAAAISGFASMANAGTHVDMNIWVVKPGSVPSHGRKVLNDPVDPRHVTPKSYVDNADELRLYYKGAWVTGTVYAQNDVVTDAGVSFVNISALTSSTHPAADATHWTALGNTTPGLTYSAQSANFSAAVDRNYLVTNTTGSTITATLPTGSNAGDQVIIKLSASSTNTVTVARGGSDTFDDGTTTSRIYYAPNKVITFISNGSGQWYSVEGSNSATPMNYRGVWSALSTYATGDVVSYQGNLYVSPTYQAAQGGTPSFVGQTAVVNTTTSGVTGGTNNIPLAAGSAAGDFCVISIALTAQNVAANALTYAQMTQPTAWSPTLVRSDVDSPSGSQVGLFVVYRYVLTATDITNNHLTLPAQPGVGLAWSTATNLSVQMLTFRGPNAVLGSSFSGIVRGPTGLTNTVTLSAIGTTAAAYGVYGQSVMCSIATSSSEAYTGITPTTAYTGIATTARQGMAYTALSGTMAGPTTMVNTGTNNNVSTGAGFALAIGVVTAFVPGSWTSLADMSNAYTVTANTTASPDDVVLVNAAGGSVTITVPNTSGARVTVKRIDSSANVVTVQASSGTIDGDSTATMVGQYVSATFVGDGTNVQIESEYGIGATIPAALASLYGQTWKPGTAYLAGSVVDYLGSKYFCTLGSNPTPLTPTFVAESHANNTTANALGTITLPTGTAAGDTVILSVMATTALTFTTRPAGWFQVYRAVTTTTIIYHLVLTHVVTAADVTAGNFALGFTSTTGQASFSCSTFRNVQGIDYANIKSAAANGASGTTISSVLAAITSTTGTMLAIASASYSGSAPTVTYSPAVTASAGTATQFDSHTAYRAITGSAVAAQTVTDTWVTAGVNAQSAVMIPLIPGPIFNADAAWVAYDKSIVRFRGQSQQGAANTNIGTMTILSDPYASTTPLYGWDSVLNYWVCPADGVYMVNWQGAGHGSNAVNMNVLVNNAIVIQAINPASTSGNVQGAIELHQGDYVAFQYSAVESPGTLLSNYFSIVRIGAL